MAIWKQYIENAYLSCSHYLVNRKLHWSERICWLVTIVTCMGCAYYVVVGSLAQYNSQSVSFKVDTDYLHWETPFPSVVICERKPLTMTTATSQIITRYVDKLNIDEKYVSDVKNHIFQTAFIIPPNMGISFPSICTEDPSKCLKLNYSETTEKIRGGCATLLDQCSYNGVKFTCCDEFLPVTTVYGQCFGFNNYVARYPNGNRVTELKWKIVRKPGLSQGNLTIVGMHKYMFISILDPIAVPSLKNEMYIFQRSHSTYLSEKAVYTHHARVRETVSLKDDKHVKVKNKGCRLSNENNLKYFDIYSEANCEIECYMKAQKEYCNCVGHFCPAGPQEKCDVNGLMCLSDKKHSDKFKALKCNCLPDCNSLSVDKIGTITKLADPSFALKKVSNKFQLNIIVPAPTMKYIRSIPTTELDVIVSIGGAVSFFLGVSFLSIAQIVYYFLVRSTTDWYRLKKEQKIREKERKMDENFASARWKLKLARVEGDIRDSMRKKIEEYNTMDDLQKENTSSKKFLS